MVGLQCVGFLRGAGVLSDLYAWAKSIFLGCQPPGSGSRGDKGILKTFQS
jgi:hypothetical protein